MSLRLAPLDCPSCGSAMRGGPFDALFFCDHCGAGAILESTQLRPVESTALLPAAGRRASQWRPAWVMDTAVSIEGRTRADGARDPDVHEQRSFVVPAFPLPLADLSRLAQALSAAHAATGEVPREPIRGGTLGLEDARTFLRHLIIGEEAAKPDLLASVEVSVDLESYRLAAIPFETGRGSELVCAVTGQRISS